MAIERSSREFGGVIVSELFHHGIQGQKWGVRRYQNEDGTLTEQGRRHLEKVDSKWARKNYNRIYNTAYKGIKSDFQRYVYRDLDRRMPKKNKSGRLSMQYVNEYNRKLAEMMNMSAEGIRAPSGRDIRFVAKRGEMGVHMALADQGYNMDALKRGVYASGRIAYKQEKVNMSD